MVVITYIRPECIPKIKISQSCCADPNRHLFFLFSNEEGPHLGWGGNVVQQEKRSLRLRRLYDLARDPQILVSYFFNTSLICIL